MKDAHLPVVDLDRDENENDRVEAKGHGRLKSAPPAAVLPSLLRSASSQSTAQTVPTVAGGYPKWLSVFLNVTASNTPTTLTCTVEWSNDGTNFFAGDALNSPSDAMTAVGAVSSATAVKQTAVKAPYWRLKYVIVGTSYTFQVDARYL